MAEDIRQLGRITEYGKIPGNTATTIFTAKGATTLRSLDVTENNGSTPNLTVEIYDVANTTSYYPVGISGTTYSAWKAKAVSAGQGIVFFAGLEKLLPNAWAVRITSSDAAGRFDWILTYDNPTAAARGR